MTRAKTPKVKTPAPPIPAPSITAPPSIVKKAREKGARAIFTEMLRDYALKHPEQSTGEVAAAIGAIWVQADRELIEEYFVSEGLAILSMTWRTDIIRTRRGVYQIVDIPNGKSALPASVAMSTPDGPHWSEKVVRKFEKQVQQLREYDPDAKQARLLLKFNRYELNRSAQWDRAGMVHRAWKIDWKLKLANGLPDDQTTVEEFYTPIQIMTALEESKHTISGETQTHALKIKVEPFIKRED